MGMSAPVYYTADMVRALPDDGNRYETVHGELLVTPAPRALHQRVLQWLYVEIALFLRREPVGVPFLSPADISWGPDVLVQPDLFVVDQTQADTLDWAAMKNLLLAAEVLSPSSVRHDRFTKRRLYQQAGIPTYWILDPDERCVEVWTPDSTLPAVERDEAVWRPAGASQSLHIVLRDLFDLRR